MELDTDRQLALVGRHTATTAKSSEACSCILHQQQECIDEFVSWLYFGQISVAQEHQQDQAELAN